MAAMEDVLDVYCRPYDPRFPVVNMDEQPFQRLDHTRELIPMKPGQPEREDYEYERNGTAAIFLFTDALAKWRRVSVREHRTAIDWAEEMCILLEDDYPNAEKVILVCDNLNTHVAASFYKAFPPNHARRLLKRLEIHYTPKHRSWLNIAECELSAFNKAVFEATNTRPAQTGERNQGMGAKKEHFPEGGRMAIFNERRKNKAEVGLP